MTYEEYLKLDSVLSSQELLTESNSELLFIVAHQSSELWFKVLIHELKISPTNFWQRSRVNNNLNRVVKIFEHLNSLWDIISTITPDDYEILRHDLGTASGKQSFQYLEVERLLKELPKANIFSREELLDVENAFKKWQFAHMKTVERIIGEKHGTGGTSGVKYLKLAVDKKLWD
jgi:tryptophan 2,3-dioxygenase